MSKNTLPIIIFPRQKCNLVIGLKVELIENCRVGCKDVSKVQELLHQLLMRIIDLIGEVILVRLPGGK